MNRPRTIGRFEIVRELGRGGMGVVYEARCADLPRSVALKVVPTALASPEALARFEREALAMAKVNHPNVVTIHDVGRAPAGPFLVTSLVEGQGLEKILARGPIDPDTAARLVADLADAIEALHAAGVLHRDLKPENVIVRPDGTPVLLDFGLARDQDARSLTETGAVLGTPAYMSPEQAAGKHQVDRRSDVYGLGAVLFACLAGRAPFQGAMAMNVLLAVMEKQPRWPSADRDVPRDLEAVCRRAMRKTPAERYATAAELRNALESYLAGESQPMGRTPWIVATGAGLCALGALALWIGRSALREPRGADSATVASVQPVSGAATPASPSVDVPEVASEAQLLRDVSRAGEGTRPWFAAVERLFEAYPNTPTGGHLRQVYLEHGLEHPRRVEEPKGAKAFPSAAAKWIDTDHAVRYVNDVSGRVSLYDLEHLAQVTSLDTKQHLLDLLVDTSRDRLVFRGVANQVRVLSPVAAIAAAATRPEDLVETLFALPKGAGAVACLDIDARGRVGFGSYLGWVGIFDPTGPKKRTLSQSVHRGRINQVRFSPNGRWLLSAGDDFRIGVWDTQEEVHGALEMMGAGRALAVHPGGRLFAVASGSFGVSLHEYEDSKSEPRLFIRNPGGGSIARVRAHTVDPRSLAFSADGARLYSAAGQPTAVGETRGELSVWDVATLRLIAPTAQRRERWFTSMALSPDERRLLTVSSDGTRSQLEVWRVDPFPGK